MPVVVLLALAAAHADVPADPHPAALLGHHATERGRLGQTGELLGTEDGEGLGLDLEAVGHVGVAGGEGSRALLAPVGILLELLVQAEAQSVHALMPDAEIREDEVAGGLGPVQVDHAGDGGAGEDGGLTGLLLGHATVGDGAGLLEGGEQEVVGLHVEGDVPVGILPLEDLELDDRGRVDGAAVRRSWAGQSGVRDGGGKARTHTWRPHHMLALSWAVG
ncbi:hypothetical protein Tdes44962_MAKER07401 [Teratosphaeria destructans]|uniref:Secreted protein n=1 Tax=Teratosphaeria destructans TaxID=418781 RepID=A0A9W7W5U4_9PEZI|nr:hypothetical protein Tdes44962_MAKER07401 [Teratosphaeria destructans]